MRPIFNRQSGFTLIEAMIAMVILAFAAASILLPFTTAADVQTESDRRILAAKLASDKLEELITQDVSAIVDESESTGLVKNAAGDLSTDNDPTYNNFSRSVNCKDAIVGGITLKWVTVSVLYNGEPLADLSTLIGP